MSENAKQMLSEIDTTAGESDKPRIAVCAGTGCMSSESDKIIEALVAELEARGMSDEVEVRQTGCFGFCEQGPIAIVYPDETFYVQVKPSDAPEIIDRHIKEGEHVDGLLYHDPATDEAVPRWHDIRFYDKQVRVVLERCGIIDPESIEHYITYDGYKGLRRALLEMTRNEIIEEVLR